MIHTFKPKRYWARGAFPRLRPAAPPARCVCGNALKKAQPFCKPCLRQLPKDWREDRSIAGIAACEQWLRMNRPWATGRGQSLS